MQRWIYDWKEAMLNNREDFEKYYETKNQLLLYNNGGGVIAYKCDFCSLNNHRTENCFDFELRRIISFTILHFKGAFNERKYYPRRSFKVNLLQKHQRRRKNTMRSNEKANDKLQYSRLEGYSGSLLHQRHHEDTPRKLSSQLQQSKRNKIYIRNMKTRNDNVRALEKIRRQHNRNNLSQVSDESESVYDLKFQELNIDEVMEYKEYYPSSNISELSTKESQRRRITRMAFNAFN